MAKKIIAVVAEPIDGDALQTFPADEIVFCTHGSEGENWQEGGVVDEARERFGKPVTHLVVD